MMSLREFVEGLRNDPQNRRDFLKGLIIGAIMVMLFAVLTTYIRIHFG